MQSQWRGGSAAPPQARQKRPALLSKRDLQGWLLSFPAVLTMIGLAAVPTIIVLVGAVSPTGLSKLAELSQAPLFRQTLWNTTVWVLVGVFGSMILGFAGALALQRVGRRFSGMWRALLLIPWVTPTVAAATAWKWFYSRDYGILNLLLQNLGIIDEPVSWLTNTDIALFAVAMVDVWGRFSFVMLMISSGLQAIPSERYEAARVDGAGAIRTMLNITLPGIRDVVFIVVLIVTVWTLNSFLPVWIMTKGGPAGATNILPVQLYQYFQTGERAALEALAGVQLVLSMAVAALYVSRARRADA
ncbi:MAG: sugar ABC transporter permease [Actinobacteria bacterium]|nr:sugar ABC transporter permease [Actinomycetota bacterium]